MILKRISNIFVIPAISLLLFTLSSCSGIPGKIIEESRLFMSTVIRIKVSIGAGDDEGKVRDAINKAYDEISRIELVYSVYDKSSEISRINRLSKDEPIRISDGVFNLIKKALEYSEKTEGAFDITVKPLIDLWSRARAANTVPDEYELKRALNRVGYKDVVLDDLNRTICFGKEGMSLDLGGVAKGYATDRAIMILRDNGVENALVASGGDMYCIGKKSKKELWSVGIRHPRNKDRVFIEMRLRDKAISTSGDYERFFMLNGKRYSHIIDPRTGYPIGDNVVSASVISPDSTTSDILATAMCVLGEKGLALIKAFSGAGAILVFKDKERFTVKMSDGVRKSYVVSKESF